MFCVIRMNLYCIKCLMFTKNSNIKIQREINRQSNIYCHCNNCGFKKLATTDKEKISGLSKSIIRKNHLID